MKVRNIVSLVLVFSIVTCYLTSCGSSSNSSESADSNTPVVLRMSGAFSDAELESNPAGRAVAAFIEEVEEKTDGKYLIEFYGGELGSTTQDYVGGLQNGAFEMVQLSQSNLGGYTKAFVPLNIPFLFPTAECVFEFLRGEQASEMIRICEEDTNMRTLAFLPIGYRHLANNKHPILTPDDCNGIKFRTMSDPYQVAMVEAFGGAAMTLSYNETFSALQQGVIDGQENPFMNLYTSKIYEVQKYLSTTGHQYTITSIFINDDVFNTFPEDIQQIFVEAGRNAQEMAAELAEESSEEARALMVEDGLEVVDLTLEQKEVFREACASVWETAKSDIGEDRYNAVMEECERIEAELGVQ